MSETLCQDEAAMGEPQPSTVDNYEAANVIDVDSPTLARLIEEVRNEEANTANAYNRMHNRHNRSR